MELTDIRCSKMEAVLVYKLKSPEFTEIPNGVKL